MALGRGFYVHMCVVPLVFALGTASAATPFRREPWLKDYSYLKTALEERYANLAWFGWAQSGVDLPALDRRTLRVLNAAENDEAAKAALLAFVSSFHDGHLSSVGVLQPKLGASPAPPKPDYSKMSADEGCAGVGYVPVKTAWRSRCHSKACRERQGIDGLSRICPRRCHLVGWHRVGIVRISTSARRTHRPLAACRPGRPSRPKGRNRHACGDRGCQRYLVCHAGSPVEAFPRAAGSGRDRGRGRQLRRQ